MSEWKRVKLQDCCLSISDGDHLPPPKTESGIPFVTIADIKNNQFDLSNTRFVPEEYFNRIDQKRRIQKGDVLFSVVGSYGIPVFAREDMRVAFQRHIAILRPGERVVPEFMYYSMLDRNFFLRADAVAIGAAQKTITLSALRSLEIDLPPLGTQRRIAAILSDYDAAIENCRKQIALLEEAVLRLYREWFGDGKGEKKRIGDVCECVLGGTPNRAKAEYWGGNVAWINSGKVNELRIVEPSEYITDLGLKKSAAKVMPRHTTVLAITGATLGQVSLLEIDSAANQSVVGVLENDVIHYEFIYPMIVSNIRKLIMHQTGGAQQHICKDDVLNFEVLIPSKSELNKYGNICRPIFERVSNLFFTIRSLTEARDRLLPKLMKGEIVV